MLTSSSPPPRSSPPSEMLPPVQWAVRNPAAYARLLRARVQARLGESSQRAGTLSALVLAGIVLLLGLFLGVLAVQVPAVERLEDSRLAEATIAYTADGAELTRYHLENRTWVPLDSIARPVVEALIATEDHRFFRHGGVDLVRLFGAVLGTAGGDAQGGSTLTMQLARNLYPSIRNDWLLARKVKEWLTAVRLEDHYSKAEILEYYLNVVPFMYDAVGIEAGARTYFEKPAAALDVTESALLVGMLKGTVYYNPVRNPERALARRNLVLRQMVRHGYLDADTAEVLSAAPLGLHFRRLTRQENRAPFFAEYVRQWLDAWAERNGYNLYTDGLRVYTTLDTRLQEAAEAAVAEVTDNLQAVVDVEWSSAASYRAASFEGYQQRRDAVTPFAYYWERNAPFLRELLQATPAYGVLRGQGLAPDSALARLRSDSMLVDSLKQAYQRVEAGFVALDPATGHVKAWVGGREFKEKEFDHVAQARRQPGSTFKPFVYATALMNGFSPYSALPDAVREYRDPRTGQRWAPRNFGGASGRYMSLQQALAHSKNTITAQLIMKVGPEKVVQTSHAMGIQSDLLAVPSLGLGTSEVTLLEMATAYATLANLGVRHDPIFITRIENRAGNVLATFQAPRVEAIPPHVAYGVLDMMRGVVRFGTAVRLRSMFGATGDLAGKTGTTQNAADGWFMLIHPNLVVGAWTGFNSPKVTFRSTYWGQGAHNALHIVGRFYRQVRREAPALLSTKATFEAPPRYRWATPAGRTESDRLNQMERRRNRLDEVINQDDN